MACSRGALKFPSFKLVLSHEVCIVSERLAADRHRHKSDGPTSATFLACLAWLPHMCPPGCSLGALEHDRIPDGGLHASSLRLYTEYFLVRVKVHNGIHAASSTAQHGNEKRRAVSRMECRAKPPTEYLHTSRSPLNLVAMGNVGPGLRGKSSRPPPLTPLTGWRWRLSQCVSEANARSSPRFTRCPSLAVRPITESGSNRSPTIGRHFVGCRPPWRSWPFFFVVRHTARNVDRWANEEIPNAGDHQSPPPERYLYMPLALEFDTSGRAKTTKPCDR